MEAEVMEGARQLTRETTITMAMYFILRRVVDWKSLGQKIRNSRRMSVLKALQLRNDSWKQRREERGGSNSFFFFLKRRPRTH